MATTSLVATLSAAIASTLAARPALAGVQVTDGWVGAEAQERESIWVGEFRGKTSIPVATAGRKQRDDIPTIDVWVEVHDSDAADVQEARARAVVLFGEIDNALADTPSFGVTAVWNVTAEYEGRPFIPDDGGFGWRIRYSLTFSTRLT